MQGKELPHIFIIFDDCISEFKQQGSIFSKFIEKLATTGRHYNISFVLSTQSYKQVNHVIRRNLTNIGLYNLNLISEVKTAADELRVKTISTNEFMDIYYKVHQEPYQVILVCQ